MRSKPKNSGQQPSVPSLKGIAMMTLVGLISGAFVYWLRSDPTGREKQTPIPLGQRAISSPAIVEWARQSPGKMFNSEPPSPPTGTDSSVSTVPLQLVLVATEPGRSPSEGYADIGVDGQTAQRYAAGAILANGARLARIESNYIVLEKDNSSNRLYRSSQKHILAQLNTSSALLEVGGITSSGAASANSDDVLTRHIRPSPVFADGVLVGYEVYPAKSQVFYQLGLQPGDLIVAVDGVPLQDSQVAGQQLSLITQGRVQSAEVVRRGARIKILLNSAAVTTPPY